MNDPSKPGEKELHAPPTFPWSQCNPKDAPENKYLVEGLIPEKGCHLVLGPPKCGKSQLLAHFLACILAKKPVFGRYALSEDDGDAAP